MEKAISCMIEDNVDALLTMMDTDDEIKQEVLSLNNDSAPEPSRFGACNYQTYQL